MNRSVSIIVVLAVCTAAVCAADLPLTRVVLFSSGVGYFERSDHIEGTQTMELAFRKSQINDILKSMVLQDLGGGTIMPVTYAPQDPLQRILGSFSIDISDNPSMAELWNQIRGAKVKVEAEKDYVGIVMGAEKQEKSVDDRILEFDVLNLLTDNGLIGIPLWHVDSIQLQDEKLADDLDRALNAIAQARDSNKRSVQLKFSGEGKRQVRVGYLLETPVWKTTYRLVSDDEGLFLQGWAIVENTTDDDWENVNLAMVSGRPVSFIQDLYQPLYLERPEVPPSVATVARPHIWEGAMEEEAAEAPAEARLGARLAAAPAKAPEPARGGYGGAAGYTPDLREGIAREMAAGEKVGTLFQYAVARPVTIPRQRSAMIPIINADIGGKKVSVYKQDVNDKHPMNGIKLTNTSDLHLMAGPITVFDDNVYAGDALIDDVPPGDERLLTYAVDLPIEVARESKPEPSQIVSVRILRGVMIVSHKEQTKLTYTVDSDAEEPRAVLIEHPIRHGWDLVQPEKPAEKTRSAYRFALDLPAGETDKLTVIEQYLRPDRISLTKVDRDRFRIYLQTPEISDDVKQALRTIVDMQSEIDALRDQREAKQQRIKEIEAEQKRIRENMAQLDRQSALYRNYVEKLTEQETEFEQLREQIHQLQEQENDKEKALEDYIMGLDIG